MPVRACLLPLTFVHFCKAFYRHPTTTRRTDQQSIMASFATASSTKPHRSIGQVVPGKSNGPLVRLIGTVDIDGKGTEHVLPEVDPFILLDHAIIPKSDLPPFGEHPHRGHSVVTLLLQGSMRAWDSFSQTSSIFTAPAAYWVDAGTGVFHDEHSVVSDEENPQTHVKLFQLWMMVQEEDRHKAPKVQMQQELTKIQDENAAVTYFVGGPDNSIITPHPIVVAHVQQKPGARFDFPVQAGMEGFVVSVKGGFKLGSTTVTADQPNHILVLDKDTTEADSVLQVKTMENDAAEYLVCLGEPIGQPWVKKLVANGAVIAQNEEEARAIAEKVEIYAENGKTGPIKSFAPFGL